MKKEKSCGAIVVNDNKQILLVKHNKGHYSFPKGHTEVGETEIETATREVKEETNIDIICDETKRFKITYNVSDDIEKDVIFFIAKPITYHDSPQLSEVSEVLWVDINEVANLLEFENIIDMWNKAKEYI